MDTQLGYGRARIRTQAIQLQRVLNQPHGRSALANWRLRCPPLKGWRPQSECGQDHEPVLPAGSVPGCLSWCTLRAIKEIFGRNVGHVQFLLCAPTSEAHPWVRLGLLGAESGMTHKCRAATSEHTSQAQENVHSKWRPHTGAVIWERSCSCRLKIKMLSWTSTLNSATQPRGLWGPSVNSWRRFPKICEWGSPYRTSCWLVHTFSLTHGCFLSKK